MKNITEKLKIVLLAILIIASMRVAAFGLVSASYDPGAPFQQSFGSGTGLQYLRGDLTWQTLPIVSALVFNNTASHSIVTTAAAANGFQLSSTRNVSVFYSVNVNTTATIGGSSDGYVVLEIASTNSTTASDWKEVSRSRNGQAITLAIALQSVQNIGSELMNVVPSGYYARLRAVTVGGTPVFTYISGQEVSL